MVNDHNDKKRGRLLGIDFGSKRVGLSLSDEEGKFALPLSVVTNTSDLLNEVTRIAEINQVKEIVMGESRNYAGEPNTIFLDSMDFKGKLESKGFIVYLESEFMTSIQAERLQGKNKMNDASAAAIILQSYIDRRRAEE